MSEHAMEHVFYLLNSAGETVTTKGNPSIGKTYALIDVRLGMRSEYVMKLINR